MDLSALERERVVSSPLLAGVSRELQTSLLDSSTVSRWSPGEHVIREGDESRALYVILEGAAQVTVHSGERDAVLADLGPGEVFGEEGVLADSLRAATVTASTSLRCAIVPARALDVHLARVPGVRRGLERLSTRRFHERLVRSVAALHDLELEGAMRADVSRVSFSAGSRMLEQGRPSDAVFFVLSGVAITLGENSGASVVLTRIGPGQCVGEVGVLRRAPRAASVFAETKVEALRVKADCFRGWVSGNPRLADFLGTLERIYPHVDGRLLSVYRSEHEGREAVTTLAGDAAGECVLSTKVLGEDTVLLARGSAELEGEREVVRQSQPEDGRARELLLDCVERGRRGEILGARICGVQVRGVGPDVPPLYHALRSRRRVKGREIKRFRRTGFLGGRTPATDRDCVCNCLGIGRREFTTALAEHGSGMETVTAVLGLGVVCGACLPRAREIALGTASRIAPGPAGRAQGVRVESTLVARRPVIDFDAAALLRLCAEPELHAVAVASVFAGAGERFMVQRISEVLPTLQDPALAADAAVFLEQESNHISAHEPLNRLLLGRIYPRSGALRRCSSMVCGAERLPRKVALAVCAAFEYVADCTFAAYLEEYYARGRRHSIEPAVHELVERSGAGPLFLWHGGEEMSHRYVAFDVMRASGAGWIYRFIGFGFLGLQAILLLIPALASLRVLTRRLAHSHASRRIGFGPALVLRTVLRGLRFLRPGFHPSQEHYPFLNELASDLEKFPDD
ncbi:MAG: cyclic nucleotide-binding domain-containing protein [Pseudomonadota bacterium]|nr:cyclic nucleotide-binding domain-containing protein [Pseudomonadota bacterium]